MPLKPCSDIGSTLPCPSYLLQKHHPLSPLSMQTLPCSRSHSPSISVQLYLNTCHTLTVCIHGCSVWRGNLRPPLTLTQFSLPPSSAPSLPIWLFKLSFACSTPDPPPVIPLPAPPTPPRAHT